MGSHRGELCAGSLLIPLFSSRVERSGSCCTAALQIHSRWLLMAFPPSEDMRIVRLETKREVVLVRPVYVRRAMCSAFFRSSTFSGRVWFCASMCRQNRRFWLRERCTRRLNFFVASLLVQGCVFPTCYGKYGYIHVETIIRQINCGTGQLGFLVEAWETKDRLQQDATIVRTYVEICTKINIYIDLRQQISSCRKHTQSTGCVLAPQRLCTGELQGRHYLLHT